MFLKHDARFKSSSQSQTFDSYGNVAGDRAADTALRRHRIRRNMMVLGLVAATALPLGLTQFTRMVRAQEAPAPAAQTADTKPVNGAVLAAAATAAEVDPAAAPMGNKDRLNQGIQEYKNGQYEESLADLQQVNPDVLGENEKKDLSEYLAKAEAAASQRKAARAEFEQGEQALGANQPVAAIGHYKSAINNKYVDEGTKAKSREQIAVAQAMMKQAGETMKSLYGQAVADYKAGNLEAAKSKFTQLDTAGYRAGLFQKSPRDYLRDIDKKLAAAPPPQPQVQPQPESQPQPTPAPAEAVAPAPTTAPAEATAPPAPAPTVTEAQQPQPTPAPGPDENAAPTPAPTEAQAAPADAKSAYHLARQQYRQGDWINARKNFEIARDMGYRPGLFEDSPAKYLARMDAKEQRDRERSAAAAAAANAQQQPAGMEGAPTTAPSEGVVATPNAQQELEATAKTEQLRTEQNRFEAQRLVEQAETARAANRLDEALALYSRANELDPNNNAAVTGRNELMRELGRQPGQTDLLAKREQQIQQQRQYITYSFNTAIADAKSAIQKNDYTAAQAAVERARVARNSNPGVFREDEIRQFDSTIADTQLALDQARATYSTEEQARQRQEAARTREEQQLVEERQRQATVSDLIREARRLTQEGHYQQALGVIDQILKIDPQNDYAQGARPLVEDRAIVLEQRQYRERYDRNVVKQYNQAEEQKVPYSDILTFPTNWPDLSAERDKTVAIERGERSEDQTVVAQLERKLPEVRFDNVGFADVIDFLRDVSSANIFVNWRALEAAGIDRNAPVTARLRDVKFSKALDTILKDVGGGTVRLGYTIDEGVITISTEEDLASNVVTRVYDIRDLIINVQDFDQPPDFQISQTTQTGGGGGGGQSLFSGTTSNNENVPGGTRAELVDSIIKLIEDTVASDSWKDNGGTVGSIRELSGQLIITQTPENQRNLIRLLEQLRETRAIQITVETRFLTVQRNFLEEIGVDFDVFVPSGQLWSQVGPINVANNTSAYTSISTLTTSVPGNIATELQSSASSTGAVPPNLEINNGTVGGAVTFLDDFQVSMLLRATQISQNSTTLTAPRLTLFNGQRAFVVVATETAYVGDLTPIVGTNAVAFDPQPAVVQSGVLLDVQATVSADRKYVTLTLRPTLQRLRTLVPFPVSALSAGGVDNPNIVNQTAFLQQPVVDRTLVRTTVSVPDGGTLLLGGQTLAGEIERESGVPVLSKIPFLKRLFTNHNMAKDEQVLLILVKPTIVIQREKEQEQFPLLGTKVSGG